MSSALSLKPAPIPANSSRKRSAEWSTRLTRSLTLKGGDELVTLGDARVVMTLYSELGINGSSVSLAVKWLSRAAETRAFEHRHAATNQVAFVLSQRAAITTVGTG